jgi:iron complex outermembrane receptor protein
MAGTDDKYDADNDVMRDITQTHEYHFFNPKFGLTYMPDKNNSVYASYSVSNRESNRNNYTERAKNEAEPRPERLFDLEAGYRYQSAKVAVGANLFFMDYKDQLILTGKISEIGEPLTTNVADSYRTGVELTVGVKPLNWLKWDGNLTLSQNKILNFIEQDVDMYDADWNWIGSKNDTLGTTDIAYSPNVVANSAFVFNFDRFEIGLFSSFVGKQFFDNTSSDDRAIDSYFVNNLSLKCKRI